MVTLNEPFNVDELLDTIKEHQFTRYPITEDGDKDHVKGFINVKEFLTEYASGKPIKIANYIHELPMISETTRISDALVRMQREHVHISLIIDEYGGTAGILTMEDILEEILICKKMTSLILNMIVGRLQKSTIIKLFGST